MIKFTFYLFTQLLEFLNLIIFSEHFLKRKFSRKHLYFTTALLLLLVNAINRFYPFIYINTISSFLLIFLILFLECRGNLRDKFLFSLLYQGLIMIAEVFLVFLFNTFFNFSPDELSSNTSAEILAMLLSKIFLFFLIRIIVFFYRKKHGYPLSKMQSTLMFLIPLGSMYLIHIQTQESLKNNTFTVHDLITVGIILSLNLITYYFHENVINSTAARLEAQKYEQQVQLYEQLYLSQLSADEKSAALRHDLNNHLITLEHYCSEQNLDAVQNYLSGMKETSYSPSLTVNTGNLSIDAILTSKCKRAEATGIHFQLELQLPKNLPVNPVHITILLGNLLDNALEACEKLPDKEEKQVSVFIRYDKPNLIFCIKNTYDGKPIPFESGFGIPRSSSKKEKGHGLGIKNVMEIVKKYHGYLKMEPEGTIMKVQVILYEI